eukprot:304842-Lingulodinium_polyedra.AAC.1
MAQIVEAYSGDPARPRWAGIRHDAGIADPPDPIDPALRLTVARKAKEELELENLRARSAAHPTAPGA